MQKKYALVIISITTSLLFLISALSIMNLSYYAKKEYVDTAEQLTNQTAATLEHWIQDQVNFVKQIAKDERIISLCLDPNDRENHKLAEEYLEDIHLSYPYYENLPIAFKTDKEFTLILEDQEFSIENGTFIIDTANNDTIGKGGLEYTYISQILDGKPYYISRIYKSIWRGNPIFVVSAPIIHDDKIIGVAMVSPQMDYFTKRFVDTVELGETGYMFMIDSSGATIAHRNRDYILNDAQNLKKITAPIHNNLANENIFFEATFQGLKKYYYSHKININSDYIENDLYVLTAKEKKEVYSHVYKTAIYSLISMLIISILLYKIYMLFYKVQLHAQKEKQLKLLNENLEVQVKERTQQLENMANRDGLTNLFNHKYIHSYLDTLLEDSVNQPNVLVGILDVDDFKKVNDCYGHKYGDTVLVKIAEILDQNTREEDLVGRYGGEEFMFVFNGNDSSKCLNIAERIRKEIANEKFGDNNISVTVSIGLAKWNGDEKVSTFINRADKQMYLAKANGKNQIMFRDCGYYNFQKI